MYSKNQLQILSLLFAHPDEERSMSEIGEILRKKPGVFQRGINALENEGILISRKRGNQRIFRVHSGYPLLNEIRSIVNKTAGVEKLLKDFVHSHDEIHIAFIFGSYA